MHRRWLIRAAVAAAAVAAWLITTAPAELRYVPEPIVIDGRPDAYIASSERDARPAVPVIAGAEKRIRWYDGKRGRRTQFGLVYLHGFSATRQEIAPVAELVADRLKANLFETRLAGHGLESHALADVRAEDWLDDAVEALAVGATVGDRLVVIGTSTGATLALALADHPAFAPVDTLIMLSPNFSPADPASEWLLRPGGPQLARLMVGANRSWTPANAQQARYWSTTYPTKALVEMMRIVELARSKLPLALESSVLTFYSPEDEVVSVARLEASLEQIRSPRMATETIRETNDPGRHVLAGDILAPQNNERVAQRIADFVRAAAL